MAQTEVLPSRLFMTGKASRDIVPWGVEASAWHITSSKDDCTIGTSEDGTPAVTNPLPVFKAA
jgi:hypothetical protein